MSFDLDDVLDLEQEFHEEGFNQGLNENTRKEFIEGKEYGYQISFQRYLVIGYYKSIISFWLKAISETSEPTSKIKSTEKTLVELLEQINSLEFDNTEANGNTYDNLCKKLKLKMRLLNVTMSKLVGDKLVDMKELIKDVGGVLEIENGNDVNDVDNGMW